MTQETSTLYTQYGAPISYYSGKTRSYFIHKQIPFREIVPSAWQYLHTFKKKVGAAVVPVVLTPDGQWWGDSSEIIDNLEKAFPQKPCLPSTPILRFSAYLFELFGDEFLLPLAMYTRWSRPEHRPFFVAEVGEGMLPGWPKFLQNAVGNKVANTMSGFKERLGFNDAQGEVLTRWGKIQLDALNTHFATTPFLFGSRPSLGDYGLIGPLYAHIGRDPLAKRDWVDTRPHLSAWVARMYDAKASEGGEFLSDDRLPETLNVGVQSMFTEMLPFLLACREKMMAFPPQTDIRFLDPIQYPMAGGTHTRNAMSYPLWMVDRMMSALARESEDEQQKVRVWIEANGGALLLSTHWPKMQRQGTRAVRLD